MRQLQSMNAIVNAFDNNVEITEATLHVRCGWSGVMCPILTHKYCVAEIAARIDVLGCISLLRTCPRKLQVV